MDTFWRIFRIFTAQLGDRCDVSGADNDYCSYVPYATCSTNTGRCACEGRYVQDTDKDAIKYCRPGEWRIYATVNFYSHASEQKK